jgi:hypothetical protein
MAHTGNKIYKRPVTAFVSFVQSIQIFAPQDRWDNCYRIACLQQGKIHQARRPTVAVNEGMDSYKFLVNDCRKFNWMIFSPYSGVCPSSRPPS